MILLTFFILQKLRIYANLYNSLFFDVCFCIVKEYIKLSKLSWFFAQIQIYLVMKEYHVKLLTQYQDIYWFAWILSLGKNNSLL